MRVVAPGQPFEASADTGVTNLVGQLGVQIVDTPDGDVITARTTSGITEAPASSGLYTAELVAPFVEGTYSIVWDHHGIFAREELEVAFSGVITIPTGGDLLTLAEYRSAVGIDITDTRNDARFNSLVPLVSDAIRAFTERDFGAPTITEDRVFEYDGSGYLDIDDASDVQSVAYTYPNTSVSDTILSSGAWTPRPQRRDDSPIFYYIAIGGGWAFGGISPEMGFERNLDVWVREHGFAGGGGQVKVGATWGWPTVPGAVKMAAIWTMQAWLSRPQGQGLTAEAIEGWSRSWGNSASGSTPRLAIPDEARDLLVQFSKGI